MSHEQHSANQADTAGAGASSFARTFASARRTMRAVLALGLVVGGLSVLASACSGDATGAASTTGGDTCVGGLVIDGKCTAKCLPGKCVANNTCVGNACLLKCSVHTDCALGQDCLPAVEDYPSVCPDGRACDFTQCGGEACVLDEGACAGDPACVIGTCPDKSACTVPACAEDQCAKANINACTITGKSPMGALCPFGNECETVTSCPDGLACDKTQCGGMACTKDEAACGDDKNCKVGKCPDDSACTLSPCSAEQCKPMTCRTAGEADALAYCSSNDCKADSECPGGYKCGLIRDPHELCGSSPKKGDNNLCGQTTEPCIDPANFAKDGATYIEGSLCILRNACTVRRDCDPCESDLDCSQVAGQRCVATGPNADKRCVTSCKTNKECGFSYQCTEGSCTPRFAGGCVGTGKFCEPCQTDEDCGSAGTTRVCVELSGTERACIDLSFPDMCMKTADCPLAPGGEQGVCGTELGAGPGDALYQRCYFPFDGNKFSCW